MRQMINFAMMLGVVFFISACDSNKENSASGVESPIDVGVMTISAKPQVIKVELPGRAVAYLESEVRPQVGGIVIKRSFAEGGFVSKGQSLYQIDPSQYEAALMNAKAELSSAKATLTSAKSKAKRYKVLLKTSAISQQDFDDAQSLYKEAQAQIVVNEANVHTAEINLEYTQVTAPIAGKIGKSSVTKGALVTGNQTDVLAYLQQIDPIYIDIPQSSNQLIYFRNQLKSGELTASDTDNVQLLLNDSSFYHSLGTIKFSDVNVDEGTGSVTLRAQFPNPEHELLPGMYVRVWLNVGTDEKAILVPQKAVTHNVKGQAVVMLVIDNKIVSRVVATAEVINNQWRIVSGLEVGDILVVSGLQKIQVGSKINPMPILTSTDN
ncbi:efflux RND transporter periplasmic adaptor subunit [Shewanella surugensis]|uniref:Efflux RND transporter periplasmic adaptor subunit n=1 Tax=Shewanella surugensis TaxID=212020 RepID=A0ABT0LCU6_9GAMM|nr:efflux RND transporter periplasmic adaptor subunit [Shewanella surugensis]MCL1125503.1 efflux RND transporter periplasmic adaptor subunit [Shewanella surugensis]